MLPATMASLTEPPESKSFHSISVSGNASSSQPSLLHDEVAVGDGLVADRDRVGHARGRPAVVAADRHRASPHAAAETRTATSTARSQRRDAEMPAWLVCLPLVPDSRSSVRGGRAGECRPRGPAPSGLAPPGHERAVDTCTSWSRRIAVRPMTMMQRTAMSVCWNFLVAQASPPMPGIPLAVSAATIVVKAKPMARRRPMNSSGRAAGSCTCSATCRRDGAHRAGRRRGRPGGRPRDAGDDRQRDRGDGGQEEEPDLRGVLDAEPDDQEAEVGEGRQGRGRS